MDLWVVLLSCAVTSWLALEKTAPGRIALMYVPACTPKHLASVAIITFCLALLVQFSCRRTNGSQKTRVHEYHHSSLQSGLKEQGEGQTPPGGDQKKCWDYKKKGAAVRRLRESFDCSWLWSRSVYAVRQGTITRASRSSMTCYVGKCPGYALFIGGGLDAFIWGD